jgi:chromosomal replication initiator protein
MEHEEEHEEAEMVREDPVRGRAADVVWRGTRGRLKAAVGADAFDRWFRAARLESLEDGRAVVAVPSDMHKVWIEENYGGELERELRAQAPEIAEVGLEVAAMPSPAEVAANGAPHGAKNGGANGAGPASAADGAVNGNGAAGAFPDGEWFPETRRTPEPSELDRRLKHSGLNPAFSFNTFVVGGNSRFAHAACEAVAGGNGGKFNPLFIYGGPGLGKTHLSQAIGQEWLRRCDGGKVVYFTCEKFTNEFIDSVRKGDLGKFRRRYRSAGLMLIDDVQFLGGKERSQEEFFHTFNTLLDGRCQVVLTSDRPASEIRNLEPRLASRFECGLTVELQPPGFETRLAILRKKADEWGVKIDDGIIRLLAEKLCSNVRRLEGGLIRVGTFTSLSGEPVTREKVEHLLRDLFREENSRQITIDAIQRQVAEHFDMRLADMTSRRRPASIANPRQIAMYLSRACTKASLNEIGEAFGGRDHGTVIHAVKRVKERMEADRETRDHVERIEARLRR